MLPPSCAVGLQTHHTLIGEALCPEDGLATLTSGLEKLDRDVKEARSLEIRLKGLDCANDLIKQIAAVSQANLSK